MEFGASAFLWGLPLAGLPVAFHLLMKRQRRHMKFPSLLFLRQVDPRLDTKRRLREWLLLAARVLLILLLILALSRPAFEHIPGLGRNVDVIVAVDNSGSMGASGGAQSTKLDLAKSEAKRLVDNLSSGSRAAVVPLVPEPGESEIPSFSSDLKDVKEQIDAVQPTDASVRTGAFFNRIRLVAEGMSSGAGKAMHVFTDLQSTTWDRTVGSVQELRENLGVVFQRISVPRRNGTNVAVASMELPAATLLPGHTYRTGGVLRNSGDSTADVRVRYRDSAGNETTRRMTVAADTSLEVRFPFTPEEVGDHWSFITVEGDDFQGDNRGGLPLPSQSEGMVELAGRRSMYGTVPSAISPTGTGRHTALVPKFRSPEELVAGKNDRNPLLVVLTWRQLSGLSGNTSKRLRTYVEDGGTLLVLPDTAEDRQQSGDPPGWVGAVPGPLRQPQESIVARILNSDGLEWKNLWKTDASFPLQFFLVKKYVPMQLNQSYTPLAGPASKRPLLATKKAGDGRIYASGFALQREWTPLVSDPSGLIVVMLHRMATKGGEAMDRSNITSVNAGEQVQLPGEMDRNLQIRSLVGETLNVTVPEADGLVFPRAGAYRISTEEKTVYVSVTGSMEEASEEYVTEDSVPVMGERKHSVVDAAGDEEDDGDLTQQLAGLSLFGPLVVLALLVWMLESWLATRLKKRDSATAFSGVDIDE